ncbi:holin [Streptomyces mirabilis]|uniref:holin n=1 Tax=Streptomyces mirabilis TaxID=68239 RepID=UPI0033C0B7C6
MAIIEQKVQASTAAGLAVGVLVTVLNAVVGNGQLMGSLPAWLQSLITLVGPPLATFLAGWFAPHTPRLTAAPEPPTAGNGVTPAA